jgi:hypothetical protein
VETTVPKSPDIPEPPPGSVVLDRDGDAWQRGRRPSGGEVWRIVGASPDNEWADLQNFGPLTVVYTPPAADPSCTGCGRPIHRMHGMWLDDLGRGHCAAGAKQGVNSHKPPADVPEPSTCTACGGTIRYLGAWVDEDGRGYCPQASAGHELTARPLAVYVIEQRTNLAAGGHAFQLLPAGFAYPSIPNAQAAVEYMAGAMRWNDRLEACQPGDRLPLFRIVEVPLANTQGGVR